MRLNLPALSLLLSLCSAVAAAQTAPAMPADAPLAAPDHVAAPASPDHATGPASSDHAAPPASLNHAAAPASLNHAAAPASLEHAAAPAMTASDIGALMDGVVPLALARDDIAGAVVTVVANGQILFAKGYGLADVAAGTKVSPDTTLFRIGSISKTFIWVQVMQQVEQGKIDLDRDINDYLDFHVSGLGGAPITMRQLMTHTAGFEDGVRDLITAGVLPSEKNLEWYVKNHLPPVRTVPGAVPSYSNYGATLAAYIVQRVTHTAYDADLRATVFGPLGMDHSSMTQPLPQGLTLSAGYDHASAAPRPFEVIPAAPVGAISSTGADMGRYMIALLTPGQLIKAETRAQMFTRQGPVDPRVDGMTLGFMEDRLNGERSVGHGGDTAYFHSDMNLLPARNIGVFVSSNSAGKSHDDPSLRALVWHAFMDRYFPAPVVAPHAIASAGTDGAALAGSWVVSRRRDHGIMHVQSALNATVVAARPDGRITVDSEKEANGELRLWTEVAPDLWQAPDGRHMAVARAAGGAASMLEIEPYASIMVLERAPVTEQSWVRLALAACLGVLAAALTLMPARALARRIYGGVSAAKGVLPLVGKLFVLLAPLALVGLLGFMGAAIDGHLERLSTEISRPWLAGLRYGGFVVLASSVVAVSQSVGWWGAAGPGLRWRRFESRWWRLASIGFSLFVLGYGVMDSGFDF